jgi:hypothetical protein
VDDVDGGLAGHGVVVAVAAALTMGLWRWGVRHGCWDVVRRQARGRVVVAARVLRGRQMVRRRVVGRVRVVVVVAGIKLRGRGRGVEVAGVMAGGHRRLLAVPVVVGRCVDGDGGHGGRGGSADVRGRV